MPVTPAIPATHPPPAHLPLAADEMMRLLAKHLGALGSGAGDSTGAAGGGAAGAGGGGGGGGPPPPGWSRVGSLKHQQRRNVVQ